jgi:hypothetical protein
MVWARLPFAAACAAILPLPLALVSADAALAGTVTARAVTSSSLRLGKKNLKGCLIFSPLSLAVRKTPDTLEIKAAAVRPRRKLPLMPKSP